MKRYGPVDKKTRKARESEIEEELRPSLHESAGVHGFAIIEEDGMLTTVTVYERKSAADEAVKESSRETGAAGLRAEASVTRLPRPARPKAKAKPSRSRRT